MTTLNEARTAQLRQTLSGLKLQLLRDITGRIRESRTDRPHDVVDESEDSETDAREGLELALLEMRAQTLAGIDDAIARLDAGKYGFCFECDEPIALRRLRALPFAVRCHSCEQDREVDLGRSRQAGGRRAGLMIDPGAHA